MKIKDKIKELAKDEGDKKSSIFGKAIKVLLAIAFIAVASIIIWYVVAFLSAPTPQPALPPHVIVTKAAKRVWQETLSVTGSLRASRGTVVSPDLGGRVTKIFFKSGQLVKAGDPLVQIYPNVTEAELHKAEADLRLSQLDYVRNKKLYEKGFVSASELDRYHSKLKADKALVEQYNATLNQQLIKAPFTGKLGIRLIDVGDYLSNGQQIVSLQQLDPMLIDFTVSQTYLSKLSLQDKVTLSADAFGDKTYDGQVIAFNSLVDASTRSISVRAQVANPDGKILPGTFAQVLLKLNEPQKYIMIPQTALVYGPDNESYVYTMKEGSDKVTKTDVVEGQKITNNQEIITSGLDEGEIVVLEGQLRLEDGTQVIVDSTQPEFQKIAAVNEDVQEEDASKKRQGNTVKSFNPSQQDAKTTDKDKTQDDKTPTTTKTKNKKA
jgi:membrane fusion protein, multidrug efflux system